MYEIPIKRNNRPPAYHSLIQITDHHGKLLDENYREREPEPGSIVMTHGEFGTAWQRQFSTGLWVRVGGGRARGWEWVLLNSRLMLAYDAPVRPEVQ